ncbi:YdeI/OmpD-associated family protein [Vallicoccus soli]|uniref:YdeI/OmpD-associated family protein n=1 Tax=Vallicoccus soli TaxID=2339232 RepID=UPI001C49A9DB|nr:hypothetical protein [Vallicoccus soli]
MAAIAGDADDFVDGMSVAGDAVDAGWGTSGEGRHPYRSVAVRHGLSSARFARAWCARRRGSPAPEASAVARLRLEQRQHGGRRGCGGGEHVSADYPDLPIEGRDQWRSWLAGHGTVARGVWVVTWKKGSGEPHVSYGDLVEEALAAGWVDSRPRAVDDRRSALLVTPRKPTSR